MDNLINFKNKNVFITGSSGYLGRALAKEYLKLGANLYLTDLDTTKNKTLFFLKNKNQKIFLFDCNLEDEKKIFLMSENLKKNFKTIHVMINNAAVAGNSINKGWNVNFLKQSLNGWEKSMKVNLMAIFKIVQSCYVQLNKTNSSIINIASIYGIVGPNYEIYKGTKINNPAAYAVSKSGLIHLTKWLASTLAPKIRVNCISPGGILRGQSKKFLSQYKKKCPLSRMAKEKDVINGCIFLSSNMSSYVTGHNLVVDGGWTII
jgi:NAD(P)-dependent dehydrogenase (short-subunit alcohol dehydrogenase family)